MADAKHSEERVKQATASAAAHALPSYLRFLIRVWKGSTRYALYERLRTVFLPTIWIARVLRIARIVLIVIEASALALLSAALFLVVFPVFAMLSLGILHAALRERGRMNRRLAPFVVDRHVLILFGERSRVLQDASHTVLVVCDQLPTRQPAAVACRMADGVTLVREHYFFYLRRTLLRKAARVVLLF
jgi:hypothetical protein